MKIFATIRFYWGSFAILFVVVLIMIPLLFLFPGRKGDILHYLNRLNIFLLGGSITTEGERDPKANMVLINHQGIIDIVAMEAIELTHMRWIAKKELFDAPWLGHLLKKGDMIPIDRQNKTGLIKLLKSARETVERKHRTIAIFPEGTRTDRQKLLPFKPGASLIAKKLALCVQPIVITGSKLLFNEHNKTAHSSEVKVIYLPAFDVDKADDDWYGRAAEDMQKTIDSEYEIYGRER